MAMVIAKILVCLTIMIIKSTRSSTTWYKTTEPTTSSTTTPWLTTSWLTTTWPSLSWFTTRTTTAWYTTTWSTTTWPTTSWSTPTWPTTTWLTTKWLTTIWPTTTWLTNGPTTTQTKTTWPTTTETTHFWLTTTWPRTTGLTSLWPTTTEPTTTGTRARSQFATTSKPSSDKESDVAKIVAPIVSVCIVLVVVVVVVFLIVRRKKMKLGNDLEGRSIQAPIYQNQSGETPLNTPTEMSVYEYADNNVHNYHILQAVQETRTPRTDNIYTNLSINYTQVSLGQNMLKEEPGPSNYAGLAQGTTVNKPADAAVGYVKLGEVERTGDGPDFSDYTSLENVDGVYTKLGETRPDPNVYETLQK